MMACSSCRGCRHYKIVYDICTLMIRCTSGRKTRSAGPSTAVNALYHAKSAGSQPPHILYTSGLHRDVETSQHKVQRCFRCQSQTKLHPAEAGGDIRMESSSSDLARSALSSLGGSGIGDCMTARGISCVGGN